MTEQ
jgi:hypothetical protein